MRALILSNCSYTAYTKYMQGVFPDWDNRGVPLSTAKEWVDAGHEAFLDFVDQADLFIGMTKQEPLASRVPAGTRRVQLPLFVFNGYHPDAVWLHGVTAPTETGAIHSRIAAAGWLTGKSATQTAALFTGAHYDRLGYFDVFASEKTQLIARFAADGGIDISDLFDTWSAQGNFLHTPNHPVAQVFFDIAHAGMAQAGLTEGLDPEKVAAQRAALDDNLATGIIWPLYPEIAEHLGIPHTPTHWRTSAARGTGVTFDVPEMIARSWKRFDEKPDQRNAMMRALGGADVVARLAGA